jgi:rhodanese-related sulfurtransferase
MTAQTITPSEFFRLRESGRPLQLIDVRTPAEHAALHAEGARLIPLDDLDPAAVASAGDGHAIYLICKSGARAAKACERFHAAGHENVYCVEGGTTAWEQAGLPVVRGTRKVISLERQVRIGAGALVVLGVALGWFLHPIFLALAAFVGCGLIFAGVTDWCGMGMLLAKMPWNR